MFKTSQTDLQVNAKNQQGPEFSIFVPVFYKKFSKLDFSKTENELRNKFFVKYQDKNSKIGALLVVRIYLKISL